MISPRIACDGSWDRHRCSLKLQRWLVQVVRKVLDMLLALIRALSKLEEPAGSELEAWESLVFHCKTLETSTNDLVAGASALLVAVHSVSPEMHCDWRHATCCPIAWQPCLKHRLLLPPGN